jgi:hypothetical protein
MKNIVLHLLASIGAFGLAVLTMQGVTQQFIHFADPINEMAVCVLALMGGVAAMFGVVEGIKEQLNKIIWLLKYMKWLWIYPHVWENY